MTIEQYNSIVVQNIRRIIQEKGMKQGAVARKAGITEKSFSEMLRNRRLIKASDIAHIATSLEVEPNDLFVIEQHERGVNV